MILPITLTITGAAAIVNFWLALRIAAIRVKGKVMIGDGGDPLLAARMRAHSNFIEYTPFVLILMALIEMAKGSPSWLLAAGILYIVGRISHMFGLEPNRSDVLRGAGFLITIIVMLGLAAYALTIPYRLHEGTLTSVTVGNSATTSVAP
jgi:uncharacterized membrane protein YecN with MAPEG domain